MSTFPPPPVWPMLKAVRRVGLTTLLVVGYFVGWLPAAEFDLSRLRRIDVPAQHPELWPAERPPLVLPRDEFERLLVAAQSPAVDLPPAVIERAVYEATYWNHTLTAGKLHLTIQRQSPTPVWQSLNPWNLALAEVAWSDGEALAGTGADGGFWLWNDHPQGALTAKWSLRGQPVADRTAFELRWPTALHSVLRLRVPQGMRLQGEQAVLRRVETQAAGGFELWELESLEPSRLRFHVVPPPSANSPTLVAVRQQLTAEIREDHIRFQARFTPEVWGGEVRELRFSIPATVELYSVTTTGDTTLPWTRETTSGPRHQVRVDLPEPARGPLKPLLLEGIIGSRASAATALPQLELVQGLFLSGQQTVTVLRPLQVAAVRMTGCRFGAPLLSTPEGETLTIEQLAPDAKLTLDLRRPTSAIFSQMISEIDLRSELWTQTTHILWSASSGSTFQAAVRLPPQWDVTSVEAFHPVTGPERVIWENVEESGGATLIRVEFFQAIQTGQPRVLRILSRRRPAFGLQSIENPLPLPLDCTVQDYVVALLAAPRFRASLQGDSEFTSVSAEAFTQPWWRSAEWKTVVAEPTAAQYLHGTDWNRWGTLRLDPEPTPVAAEVQTTVQLEHEQVLEEYHLTLRPTEPCERLLVWLSESQGEVTWKVETPAALPLLAQRLEADQLPIWKLPLAGELWELRLAPTDAEELVVSGRRMRPRAVPGRCGLLFLPQARPFTGVLTIHLPESSGLDLIPRGLTPLSGPPEATSGSALSPGERWRYSTPEAELRWVSRAAPRIKSAALARMELHTLVSAPDEPFDYHRAFCRIESHGDPLAFRFPPGCEPLTAKLNGHDLGPISDGQVLVPASREGGPQELEFAYRTASRSGFLACPRTVSTPRCDHLVWTQFRWEFSLPPTSRLWSEPSGVRLAQALRRPAWTERLFGPFGRPAGESIFWPWSAASWSQLLAEPEPTPTVSAAAEGAWSSPAGWQHYVAYAPAPPAEMAFQIWRGGRMQLLAWLAVLLGLVGVMGLRRAGSSSVVYVLAALLAATCVVEPPLTDLVGGLWTGALWAVLLPRRWLERVRHPSSGQELPSNSAARAVRPLWPIATAIWVGSLGLHLGAQPPAKPTSPEIWPVWVPVDPSGQPSQRLPVVYTTEEVVEGLRAAARSHQRPQPPSWLFSRAVYRLRAGSELPAVVFAAYDVVIAGPELLVPIHLPLQGVSVSACRVDGHVAALTAMPDGSGYQVTIARPEAPVSAIGEPLITRHTIMIELYRPWRLEGSEALVSFQIPLIHDCRVLIETLGMPLVPRLPYATGETAASDVTSAQVEYGPAQEFLGVRSLGSGAGRRPSEPCRWDTAELLIVGPNLLQARTRTVFTPPRGMLQQLTLQLPPAAVLQHLETTPVSGYKLQTDDQGQQTITLKFSEEIHQTLVVRCDYVLRKPTQTVQFMWQGLSWSSPDDVTFLPRQRILALASLADLQVQPQSVEDSGLAPLSLETTQDVLADLLTDARPRALYQVSSEQPIPFRISTVPRQRRLREWKQHGLLRRDRLTWTMSAVIEPPPYPIYSHVLVVDRRLQIESISARERNVERVLRWSETRSVDAKWVTVFLTDPSTEVQQLRVVGSMPLGAGESFSLPNVWMDNAESPKGLLELAAEPTWQLEWTSLQRLQRSVKPPSPPGPESPLSGLPADWPNWEFEVQDSEWRATARLRPYDESLAVRAVHVLLHAAPDVVELHSRVEIPAGERPTPVTIELPHPWEGVQSAPVPGLQVGPVETTPEGRTLMNLVANVPGAITFRWQAQAAWSRLPPGAVPLPHLRSTRQREVLAWAVEVAPPPLVPRLDADPNTTPPPWAQDWFQELVPMAPAARWLGKLPAQPASWPLAAKPSATAPPQLAWLEHRLWRQAPDADQGATWIRLQHPVPHLTVHCAPSQEITAALIDGAPGVLLTAQDTECRLSAADGRPFWEAVVFWRSAGPAPAPWSGLVEVLWPALSEVQGAYQALTLFPADHELVLPLTGWSRSDWVDRLLQRLESLADAATEPTANWHTARLWSTYSLAAEKLAHRADALGDSQSPRRERWQALIERLNQTPAVSASRPRPPLDQTAPLEDLLVDHPRVLYGALDPSADHTWLWRVEGWGPRLLSGGVLFLAALVSFRLIRRPRWREWLRRHPNGATALLGLLWWLCLTPSILGVAILGWSGYRALNRLTTPPAA